MRYILFIISLVSFFQDTVAQQYPSYTQYNLNTYALNPATAGLKPCNETTFGRRRSWVGFEGAPENYFFSFNTRINKEDKYPDNFHGVGLTVSHDRNGFSINNIIRIGYAYQMKLWTNYRLSLGIFAGMHRQTYAFNAIRMPNKQLDPAFDDEVRSGYIYPEVSPGGYLYNKNLFVGLSMFQLYPSRTRFYGTKKNRLTAHYFFTTGYRLRGRKIDVLPSLLLNFSPFISPTLDLTLTMDYKQKVSLALGSKYLNSGYATLQLRILPGVHVGYSYEYAFNELSNVSPVTNEFMIQFGNCMGGVKELKTFCPAYQ